MVPAPVLHVSDLHKRFTGRRVLDGLSFQVTSGEVVGISGPNGSGKSTLLQLLCGLLRPSRGGITYRGASQLTALEARPLIGFSSPALSLYDDLSAAENLRFFADWRGVPCDPAALLARVGLDPARRDPLRAYSSGMRQRVKLAWAIQHNPPILMLDEPGSNLDEPGRAVVASLVAEWSHRGWVMIASNDEEELALCTRRVSLG
ncbi:MAG TPA: ABC transporter ATP-binding protein [Armatimonadota bacterium]